MCAGSAADFCPICFFVLFISLCVSHADPVDVVNPADPWTCSSDVSQDQPMRELFLRRILTTSLSITLMSTDRRSLLVILSLLVIFHFHQRNIWFYFIGVETSRVH